MNLSDVEKKKRAGLASRKPCEIINFQKFENENKGIISPIIRIESYLCNFQCTHCSAELYILEKKLNTKEHRDQMTIEDIKNF